jgi:ribosomal-protein-alanine N-acetyltransferase
MNPAPMEIRTARLLLRRFRNGDRKPLAMLNADAIAMEHFPGTLTREESDAMGDRIAMLWETRGFSWWSVEAPGVADFVGLAGLAIPRFEALFMPTVEIGWRFLREHWGHGYCTEAATAAMDDGFERMELPEIVSFTVPANRRSWRVMERLGMTRDPRDDFDHPMFLQDERIRRHFLYRMSREAWRARKGRRGVALHR